MSRGRVETATVTRGSPFPAEWGFPPGAQFSEERARWARSKALQHQRTAPQRFAAKRMAELEARDRRLLHSLRLAQLGPRRDRPTS